MTEVKHVSIGEICDVVAGGTPSRTNDEYWGGDVAWVKISDMLQGVIRFTDESITSAGLDNSTAKILPAGTLLLSIFATIGRVAMLGIDAATNQAIAGLKIRDRTAVDPNYLRRLLEFKASDLVRRGRGIAQNNINSSILRAMQVSIPPLVEQVRIAAILDLAGVLKEKRATTLSLLDSIVQAEFHNRFGDPVSNPMRFPIALMQDLVDRQRPISYGILMPGPDIDVGIKYVRVVDMKDGGIDTSTVRKTSREISNAYKRSLLSEGDLLMSIRGHVGRMASVPRELMGANITQDTARLAIVGAESVFVRECLRTTGFQKWMAQRTKGAAVRGINLGDVKQMPIILPAGKDQESFVRFVEAAESLHAQTRKSRSQLDRLFLSLQQRAFRGEL